MLRLRLRLPGGTSSLQLDPSTPFSALLREAAKAAGFASDDSLKDISLKVGMPPQRLLLEGTAPISDGIKSMETITVSWSAPSSVPPLAAAAHEIITLSDDDDDDEPHQPKRARVQVDADRVLAEQLAREEEQSLSSITVFGGQVTTMAQGMFAVDPQRLTLSFARDSGRVRGALAARARVGTSGFAQLSMYPTSVKDAGKHQYYAERFGAAELNGLFYRIPAASSFESWRRLAEGEADRADPYELVCKCNDFFTHKKRLIVDESFIQRWDEFMSKCRLLGARCPAVLLQFNGTGPQAFKRTAETHARLQAFADLVTAANHVGDGFDPTFVFEFRHASWYVEEVYALLEANARLTLAQIHHAGCGNKFGGMADGWFASDAVAARLWRGKLLYVRVHGPSGFTRGDYGRAVMATLAARMKAWLAANPGSKAYAFFNNDAHPGGPPDAVPAGLKAFPSCAVCDGYALGEFLSR